MPFSDFLTWLINLILILFLVDKIFNKFYKIDSIVNISAVDINFIKDANIIYNFECTVVFYIYKKLKFQTVNNFVIKTKVNYYQDFFIFPYFNIDHYHNKYWKTFTLRTEWLIMVSLSIVLLMSQKIIRIYKNKQSLITIMNVQHCHD